MSAVAGHRRSTARLRYATERRGVLATLFISPAVTGYVKLDNRFFALAGMLAGTVATAKAEKEAKRLVKVFARASRAIDDNPAHVHEQVRQRPDVPPGDLEDFRQLLQLR